tara:strand:- start:681 stop:848 length:168 start_codon:yes stop_codon:yes gene_type:complete
MVKMSKEAKARIKRMSQAEKKALLKAAAMLADCDAITNGRYLAIRRAIKSCYSSM